MNQQDRKEFEIVHLKIDELKKDIVELKADMEKAHSKTDENLSFIKENLFNPNEGYGLKQRRTHDIVNNHRSGE